MNVDLGDGTIVEDVPDDITKDALITKLKGNGYDTSKLEGSTPSVEAAPAPSAPTPAKKQNPLLKSLKNYGEGAIDFYKAIPGGLDKFGASLDRSIQGGLNAIGVPNMQQPIGENADLQQMATEARARSPIMGGAGQVVGEEAIPTAVGAGLGHVVGGLVKGKRAYDALSVGRKVAAATAEGVAGGAASGALAPQEGNRLVGAGEGAVVGGGLGAAAGLLGRYAPAFYRWVKGGMEDSRAGKFFIDTFGKDKVQGWVNALRSGANEALPSSSVAGRLGSDELATAERFSRKYATEGEGAAKGWRDMDAQTRAEGREAVGTAVGDDIAQIQPQMAAKEAALKDVEAFLDKKPFGVKFKADINKDLPEVLKGKQFGYSTRAHEVVEDILSKVNDPNTTNVGELARIWQQVGADSRLSPGEAKVIREKLVQYADHASGANLWSEGVQQWQEASDALKKSGAASKIYEEFVPQSGVGGKKMSGANVAKSVNRQSGLSPDGLEAVNRLDDVTRGKLEEVLQRISANEAPKAPAPGRFERDNPWQRPERESAEGQQTLWGNVKSQAFKQLYKVIGDRNQLWQNATDRALQDPEKFAAAFDAAVKAGEITAKDAERARRILGITAAATGSTGVSTAHPVRIELRGMAQ